MTHANIKKATKLMNGVMCLNERLGKYCANISFFGVTENVVIDLMNMQKNAFKIYRLSLNDPDFEEQADICMSEIDAMAVEETRWVEK